MAAYKRMSNIYEHWMSSPNNELTIRKELNIPANIPVQPQHCTIYLNALYEYAKGSPQEPFNLDAKINVQRFMQNGKSRYAIAPESYGVFSDIFNFMDEDNELTNIWFNEDALVTTEFLNEHNVTEDEWVERAEIYIERLDSPYDILSMEIVNQKLILEIDPNLDNVVEKLIVDNQVDEDIIESEKEESSEDLEEVEVIQESKEFEELQQEEVELEELETEDQLDESEELEFELDSDDCEKIIEESGLDEEAD